jgi:hypothetical protein
MAFQVPIEVLEKELLDVAASFRTYFITRMESNAKDLMTLNQLRNLSDTVFLAMVNVVGHSTISRLPQHIHVGERMAKEATEHWDRSTLELLMDHVSYERPVSARMHCNNAVADNVTCAFKRHANKIVCGESQPTTVRNGGKHVE